MSDRPVAAKLGIRSGFSVRLIAPPTDCAALLGPMPTDATLHSGGAGPFDAVILFVPTTETLTTHSANAVAALKPGGLLWLAYPKKTGAIASDMTRERAWEAFAALEIRPVSQIAIDETWSALRFRPVADVKSRGAH
jgi:hypothetical protein